MILNLFSVFWKNLQIIFNSKLSSMILIAGPIFLILISGSALQDTSLRNINLGLYSGSENEFTNEFVLGLKEKSFIVNIEDSLEQCKNNVIGSITHGCLELRKAHIGINNDTKEDIYYDVELSVDFSKQRIVWGIISSVRAVIDSENKRIRQAIINRMGEDIDSLVSDIKQREASLNTAISRSKLLKERLNSLNDNIKFLKGEREHLTEVENEINAAKQEVNNLNRYLESGLNGTYGNYNNFLGLFSLIDNSLEMLNSSINNADKNFKRDEIVRTLDNMDAEAAISHIDFIRQDLLKSQDYLEELKIDLENIKNIDVERASDPISLRYGSASNTQEKGFIEDKFAFLDYLFPSFIMFFLLLASVVFAATIVIRERASKAHIRNVTSKTSGFNFVLSHFTTSFLIIFIQIALLFYFASFFLNLSITSNLLSTLTTITISIAFFVLVGLALGYIFNSQETTIIAAISVGLLIIIFSPLITPVETLPTTIGKIVNLSPLVLLETKLRQSLIFGIPFNLSLSGMISLILMIVLLVILIALFYNLSKEKEI